MAVEQHRQPDAEPRPIDRLVDSEGEGPDIVGVAMVTIVGCISPFRRLPGRMVLGRQQRIRIEVVLSRAPKAAPPN